MKRLLIVLPLLTGCAQFHQAGTAIQAAELRNNRAEVIHAEAELCQQIRAGVLMDVYADDLPRWHSFCEYE